MLCLCCKRLSPPRSAFCAFCEGGKSFNGIYCSSGHRCGVGTRSCPTCGNTEFSEHVWGLPTGWIAKIASVAILVYVWKVGLAHGGQILPILGRGIAYTFGFLTNSDSNALEYLLRTVCAYSFIGWLIGMWLHLMPGQGGAPGRFLRSIPARYWQLATRYVPKLLVLVWRGVVKLSGLAGHKIPAGKVSNKPGKGD